MDYNCNNLQVPWYRVWCKSGERLSKFYLQNVQKLCWPTVVVPLGSVLIDAKVV